jgi:hypothetical protein
MYCGTIARVGTGEGEWTEGAYLLEEGGRQTGAESGLLVHLSEGGQAVSLSAFPPSTLPELR